MHGYITLFTYRLSSVVAAFVLSGAFSQSLAYAQSQSPNDTISFDIIKGCLFPTEQQGTFLSTAGKAGGDDRLGRLNLKCDHQFLMAQGISVHRLNDLYQENRLKMASAIIKKQSAGVAILKHFAFDGTCLLSDVQMADAGGDPDGGWIQCEKRLKRAVADAVFMTREETLRLNAGRTDLISGKGVTFVAGLDSKNTQNAPDSKIIKDLRQLAKPAKPQGNAPIDPAKRLQTTKELLSQPRAVNFGSSGGAATIKAVESAQSGELFDAKKQNLNDLRAAPASKTSSDGIVEVADTSAQAKFSKVVGKWNLKALTDQQKKDLADAEATRKVIATSDYIKPIQGQALVSEQALKAVVDEAIAAAKKRRATETGKAESTFSDNVVDDFDISVSIKSQQGASGAAGLKPGAKPGAPPPPTVDDMVQQKIKDVESAVDNIKNSAP